MKLSNLKPAAGSTKNRKRIARGPGSGKGGTAARGHKGAKSRSGWSRKRNFEGGQMPLQMRLPKVGFKNADRIVYQPMNLDTLENISKKYGTNEISLDFLVEKGIVKKTTKVKILGKGELSSKVTVTAHKCSEAAKQTIENLGGSVNLV